MKSVVLIDLPGRGALRRLSGLSVALMLPLLIGIASGPVGIAAAAAKPATRAVSAGRDHRVVVGVRTELSGRVGAAWRGLPDRWRIVSEPRNARGHEAPKLSSATSLDAGFRAKVPGQYTLRLTAGRGSNTKSDAVVLSEIPQTPMVPIETLFPNGKLPAIRVGTHTYSVPEVGGGRANTHMQVLVLNRKTTGEVANRGFAMVGAWASDVDNFLATLNDGDLVIVATWPNDIPPKNAGPKPLARIGAELLDAPADANAVYWYSAIGVPKMHEGEADQMIAPAAATREQPAAAMRGYLSPDQYLEYGYIPSRQVIRHYGADNRCAPDETWHGIRCPVASEGAGFWVESFTPYTFTPIESNRHYFATGGSDNASQQYAAALMAEKLGSIPRGDVVTVESMSSRAANGAYLSPVGHNIDRQTMEKLALAVARVGGTRNAFNRAAGMVPAAASAGAVYTLVGWAGAGEGKGAESAADVNGVGDTARLDLVLRPDHESLLRPAEVTTNGDPPSALSELVLDRGKDKWPLADDPGAMRAFAYLGSTDGQLGSDPRSAYWTQDLNQTATNAMIAELEHVAYPTGSDFTKEQFETARVELIKELGWVGKVRAYLGELSSPFTDNALSSWATVQTVADKVYKSVAPPNDETATSWTELVKLILHMLDPVTAGVSGHVADLLDFGVWAYGASKSGAPTSGEFRVKANELGARLVERALEAKPTYDRVGDAIVSDYAALRELGTNAGCNPSDPKCPRQWAFTRADKTQASVDVYRAAEALAYQTMIPLGYWVYEMRPAVLAKPPIYQEQYKCGGGHPFSNVSTKASATLLQALDTKGKENEYQVYALAQRGYPSEYPDPPTVEVRDRMFDPVSQSGDPNAGGLGIPQAQFMADAEHEPWFTQSYSECFWQP